MMNLDTQKYITIEAYEPYYASYDPIYSEDERWFLIILKDEYIISKALPFTNHQGDVYLVNSETGQKHRITYTPAVLETDIHWIENGNIAFTEVIYAEHELTLEEAMNVEPVPKEAIVAPEYFDEEGFYDPFEGVLVSPDPTIGAWTASNLLEKGIYAHELSIGDIYGKSRTPSFTITFEASIRDVVIGWRPSDYPYEQQE